MGINKEIFVNQKDVDIFICTICAEVSYPTSTTRCGDNSHIFCTECISKWLKENATCPNCKHKNPAIEENIFVQKMITSKKVKCLNEGCNFTNVYSDLLKHECPFEKLHCENEGCNDMIPRREMKSHQQKCVFRLVLCDYCNEEIIFKDKKVKSFI